MSDRATDDRLWAAYKRGWDSLNGKPGATDDNRHAAGLYTVAAETWDEGFKAGVSHESQQSRGIPGDRDWDVDHSVNPYQGTTNG